MPDAYFEVRRQKTHMFLEVPESSKILELKKIIEGIMKVPVNQQILYHIQPNGHHTVLSPDDATFSGFGLNSTNSMAHAPTILGLKLATDAYLCIDNMSVPPPISDIRDNGAD